MVFGGVSTQKTLAESHGIRPVCRLQWSKALHPLAKFWRTGGGTHSPIIEIKVLRMNVFQYQEQNSGSNGFVPRFVTGETMDDNTPRRRRIAIMAARVQRGEEVFHPAEIQIMPPKTQRQTNVFLERPDGTYLLSRSSLALKNS
jgi:hypothetical protein